MNYWKRHYFMTLDIRLTYIASILADFDRNKMKLNFHNFGFFND
jgi:hypothetical protein